ncbi:polysaccharide deacetylase family protein [Anaerovorax sp. IOR16]|uniref:polysaccharide deacetylase family protein n=1 Tax=Anaerovorax sp. IOR16 TaxID=2773458 RepID=UPI0019D2BD4D|nr:polysaccharide deacetylase family protein [Anaerovorax sp. IOR16]
MYWGSVRFFKHLIFGIIFLLILIPTIGCAVLGNAYLTLEKEISEKNSSKNTASDIKPEAVYALELNNNLDKMDYQKKYEDLYIKRVIEYKTEMPKTVYLTFDDGPSINTEKILDILKELQVHATFFVIYKNDAKSRAIYKRIVDEGHTLGVHSTCHEYSIIYQSVEAYLDDFATTALLLEEVTGIKPTIFRFPGGSINAYNHTIYQELIAEMLRRGYTYYDWNVASSDTSTNINVDKITNNVINGVHKKEKAIVLMHDSYSKTATVAAIPKIVRNLQVEGYQFANLDNTIKPICFSYIN